MHHLSLWFPPLPMRNSLLNTLHGSDESETLIALNRLAHLPNHNEVNMLDNYFNSSRLTHWNLISLWGSVIFSHINAFEVYSPVGFPFFLWHINWHCTGKSLTVFHLAQKFIFQAQISTSIWQEVTRGWLDATKIIVLKK